MRRDRGASKIPTTSCASNWKPRWRAMYRWCRCWWGMRRCQEHRSLPASLASMAFRQSIEVRPDPDFHNDATRLVSALRAIIDPNAPHVEPLSVKPKRTWMHMAGLDSGGCSRPLRRHAGRSRLAASARDASARDTHRDHCDKPGHRAGAIALSPDGRQIVYRRDKQWHVAPLAARTGVHDCAAVARHGRWYAAFLVSGQPVNWVFHKQFTQAPGPGWRRATDVGARVVSNGRKLECRRRHPVCTGLETVLARIAATGGTVTKVTHLEEGRYLIATPVFLPGWTPFPVLVDAGGKDLRPLPGFAGWRASPVRLTVDHGEFRLPAFGMGPDLGRFAAGPARAAARCGQGGMVGAPVILTEGSGVVSTSATDWWPIGRMTFQPASGSSSGAVGPVTNWEPSVNRTRLT